VNAVEGKIAFQMVKLAVVLVILIASLVYSNSLDHQFVWDDVSVIVDNNFIKSCRNIPLIFTKKYLTPYLKIENYYICDYRTGSGEASYRPVVTLSYFADYAIWKLNPLGFHLTNLLLHVINAASLLCLIYLLSGNLEISLWASLLFAVHPVNSEAVNVISFREDLLAFLFFIISFIFFVKYATTPTKQRLFYLLSLSSFLLALFAKEMAVTLPFILILYDYFFASGPDAKFTYRRFKSRYLSYFVILAFYLWIRFIVIKNPGEPRIGYPGGNFYTNIITMSQVFFYYIKWMFFPVNIPVILREFHLTISHSAVSPKVLSGILLCIIGFSLALKIRRSSKLASFAIFYFFITLLPVSNAWPLANFMASRYLYIPLAGFCAAFPSFGFGNISRTRSPGTHRLIIYALTLFLIFCCVETIKRNNIWSNDFTLAREMLRQYPNSARVHLYLGDCFLKSACLDKAIKEYEMAAHLEPRFAYYHKSLGIGYCLRGRLTEASAEFEKALELNRNLPDLDIAYMKLGTAFENKGLFKNALDSYRRAAEINPASVSPYFSIGNLCDRAKNHNEAIKAYEKVIEIGQNYIEAYNNMASAYADMGEIDIAIGLWNRALQIEPNFITAHWNLAVFYFQQKNFDLAVKHCDKVKELGGTVDPGFLKLLLPYRK
jgi:tetratricopeptide (TPR) repeat protein